MTRAVVSLGERILEEGPDPNSLTRDVELVEQTTGNLGHGRSGGVTPERRTNRRRKRSSLLHYGSGVLERAAARADRGEKPNTCPSTLKGRYSETLGFFASNDTGLEESH